MWFKHYYYQGLRFALQELKKCWSEDLLINELTDATSCIM